MCSLLHYGHKTGETGSKQSWGASNRRSFKSVSTCSSSAQQTARRRRTEYGRDLLIRLRSSGTCCWGRDEGNIRPDWTHLWSCRDVKYPIAVFSMWRRIVLYSVSMWSICRWSCSAASVVTQTFILRLVLRSDSAGLWPQKTKNRPFLFQWTYSAHTSVLLFLGSPRIAYYGWKLKIIIPLSEASCFSSSPLNTTYS